MAGAEEIPPVWPRHRNRSLFTGCQPGAISVNPARGSWQF